MNSRSRHCLTLCNSCSSLPLSARCSPCSASTWSRSAAPATHRALRPLPRFLLRQGFAHNRHQRASLALRRQRALRPKVPQWRRQHQPAGDAARVEVVRLGRLRGAPQQAAHDPLPRADVGRGQAVALDDLNLTICVGFPE